MRCKKKKKILVASRLISDTVILMDRIVSWNEMFSPSEGFQTISV